MKRLVPALAALIAIAGCAETQPITAPNVQVHSTIELNGPMPRAFREFVSSTSPHGALYVTSTGGGGGRVGDKPSLDAAKAEALERCKNLNPDRECVLYATKTP